MVPKALRKWLWCLLFLCSYFYVPNVQIRYLQQAFDSKLSAVTNKNTPVVIALGDSLLAYSLPHEQQFQTLLNNKKIWIMYYMPLGAFNSIDWILELKNKRFQSTTIILQDSLFLNRERKTRNFSQKMNLIKRAFIHKYTKNIPFSKTITQEYNFKRPDVCGGLASLNFKGNEFNYQGNILNKETILFLQRLKLHSKKIIVISLPRSDTQQERLQNKWRVQLQHELAAQGIQYVSLGAAMPTNYYCDGSHPNDMGRNVRTLQFLKLLNGVDSSTR